MSTCIITGSLGLVGSHAVKFFADKFDKVIGIDNDQRQKFFGTSGAANMPQNKNYEHLWMDIRSSEWTHIYNEGVKLIIHAAGQPSHDYAVDYVINDFNINAWATVFMLEQVRKFCPEAVFIFCSTNKVYGDLPNDLSYYEERTRYTPIDELLAGGFKETKSVDNRLHSFFGCSKLAADLYCQEYGKNLGLKTGIFRAGCITGPGHGGAVLHGFLSYLVKCFKENLPYTIFGYKGKQVRDQIHAYDLITAFYEFYKNPNPGEVYNIGGGTYSNCSVLEAINILEDMTGERLSYSISEQERTGDHKWWISDVSKFRNDYPDWEYKYNLTDIIKELV